jgi:hypothetical protein
MGALNEFKTGKSRLECVENFLTQQQMLYSHWLFDVYPDLQRTSTNSIFRKGGLLSVH